MHVHAFSGWQCSILYFCLSANEPPTSSRRMWVTKFQTQTKDTMHETIALLYTHACWIHEVGQMFWCRLHLGQILRTGRETFTPWFVAGACRYRSQWATCNALVTSRGKFQCCLGQCFFSPAGSRWYSKRQVVLWSWMDSVWLMKDTNFNWRVSGNCISLWLQAMLYTQFIQPDWAMSYLCTIMVTKAEENFDVQSW